MGWEQPDRTESCPVTPEAPSRKDASELSYIARHSAGATGNYWRERIPTHLVSRRVVRAVLCVNNMK